MTCLVMYLMLIYVYIKSLIVLTMFLFEYTLQGENYQSRIIWQRQLTSITKIAYFFAEMSKN